jgi:hypothetical protein
MNYKLRAAAKALYDECVIIRQHPERHLHPHVDTIRDMEAALREAEAGDDTCAVCGLYPHAPVHSGPDSHKFQPKSMPKEGER